MKRLYTLFVGMLLAVSTSFAQDKGKQTLFDIHLGQQRVLAERFAADKHGMERSINNAKVAVFLLPEDGHRLYINYDAGGGSVAGVTFLCPADLAVTTLEALMDEHGKPHLVDRREPKPSYMWFKEDCTISMSLKSDGNLLVMMTQPHLDLYNKYAKK